MDRRRFLLTSLAGAVAEPLAAGAQPPRKVHRLGYLASSSPSTVQPQLNAFKQKLGDLGYVGGRNVVFEYRWAEGKYERLSALAKELTRAVAGGSGHRVNTILVVDDRPNARYSLARPLAAAGFDVRETATGRDALRLARKMRQGAAKQP